MFDFHLSREDGNSVLRITGEVAGDDDGEVLTEAFRFVQDDDRLVVDLSAVEQLDAGAARLLHDLMTVRSVIAESVIVTGHDDVLMQLVLHDVDRVCPIVPTIADAIGMIVR